MNPEAYMRLDDKNASDIVEMLGIWNRTMVYSKKPKLILKRLGYCPLKDLMCFRLFCGRASVFFYCDHREDFVPNLQALITLAVRYRNEKWHEV